MSYCEDYVDPFPRDCEHGVPDGINCDDCADEAMEDDQDDLYTPGYVHPPGLPKAAYLGKTDAGERFTVEKTTPNET